MLVHTGDEIESMNNFPAPPLFVSICKYLLLPSSDLLQNPGHLAFSGKNFATIAHEYLYQNPDTMDFVFQRLRVDCHNFADA
jgi:hypothetical protein